MKNLNARIGLKTVIAISLGSMLGSGIFVLPGPVIAMVGDDAWLAYFLAGLCVLPAAVSKSELATAMPNSGGTYVYLERTFGPLTGTVAGLGLWLSLLLKCSFALAGIGSYLSVFSPWPLLPTALTLLFFLTILNILGIGKVGNVIVFIVLLSIFSLTGISMGALFSLDTIPSNALDFTGKGDLIGATAMVFVSYAGLTKVAAIAEEIKEPEKNLPKGIFFSLLIVLIVYCSVTYVMTKKVPLDDLKDNFRPLFTFAGYVWRGPGLSFFISVVAVFTMASMANSGLLAASRFPFAMGRDFLLPKKLGEIHPKFLTPIWSIILSGIVTGICLIYLDLTKIAKLASAFMIMIYMTESIAVILLREMRIQWYKPEYRSRLYPFPQILGICSSLFLLYGMDLLPLFALVSIGLPGLMLYFFYGRQRTTRKGVLGFRGKRKDLFYVTDTEENPADLVKSDPEFAEAHTMVALLGKERSPDQLIELGCFLSEEQTLEVAYITEVPEQTDIHDLDEEHPVALRSLHRRAEAMADILKTIISFDPITTHDLLGAVHQISQRSHCRYLIMEWGGRHRGRFTLFDPLGWLKDHLDCHLLTFNSAGVRYIKKIMVFIRGLEDDELSIKIGLKMSRIHKANLNIIQIFPSHTKQEDLKELKKKIKEKVVSEAPHVYIHMVKCDPGENIIKRTIQLTSEYDLMVFSAGRHSLWNKIIQGSLDDVLMTNSSCAVLSVQKKR
tara:strand:- start:1041 stop:3221 length:2181 start_codon:yes stop_codon:yes gene_type:complete